MANSVWKYATAQNVSVTSASFNTICTLAASEFEANKTYIIIAAAAARHTSASNEILMRVIHGTTPTNLDEQNAAKEVISNTMEAPFFWIFKFTQPSTTEDITLQGSSAGAGTGTVEIGMLLCAKVSDDFTENTDWGFAEDLTNHPTTTTPTNGAAITFTPNGADTYLVMGCTIDQPGGTANNYLNRLNDTVAGVLSGIDREGEDITNERVANGLFWGGVPTNVSHTFSVQYSHESAAGTIHRSAIFWLRLNKFKNFAISFAAAEETPAASPSWTITRSLSITPTNTGDFVVFGGVDWDINSTTDDGATRLQINPDGTGLVDDPAYTNSSPAVIGDDPSDVAYMILMTQRQLTAGAARAIELGVQRVAGTVSVVENRLLAAWSVELAASNTITGVGDVGTGESAPNPALVGTVLSAGDVATGESVPNPAVAGIISNVGNVASAFASDSQQVNGRILSVADIATAENVPNPTITEPYIRSVGDVGSAESVPTPAMVGTILSVGNIASAENAPTEALLGIILTGDLASGENVPNPALLGTVLSVGNVGSAENVPTEALLGAILAAGGIPSAEDVPQPTVTAPSQTTISNVGDIASAFASDSQQVNGVILSAGNVGTAENVPTESLTGTILSAGNISSGEVVSTPQLNGFIVLTSVGSAESVPTEALLGTILAAGGIASAESVPTESLSGFILAVGNAPSGESVPPPTVLEPPTAGAITNVGNVVSAEVIGGLTLIDLAIITQMTLADTTVYTVTLTDTTVYTVTLTDTGVYSLTVRDEE